MNPNNNQNNNQKPLNNNQNNNQQNNQANQGGMQKPSFNSAIPSKSKWPKLMAFWGKVKAFLIKHKVIIIVALAILAVVFGAISSNNKIAKAPQDKEENTEVVKDETKAPAVVSELSYVDALKAYNGKTLTIGDNCITLPNNPKFKVGTRVLMNNISRIPVTVSLDNKSVTINSYHYATTSLKNVGEFKLSCNNKEVLTVVVEQ